MKTLTLFEYEWSDPSIQFSDYQLAAIKKHRRQNSQIVEVYGKMIKATSLVGVLQVAGLTIEILPKLYKHDESKKEEAASNLLHMLQYTRKLSRNLHETDQAQLRKKSGNFFEVLVFLFGIHLSKLLRIGLYRTYIHVDESAPFLKGTWRIAEQLSKTAVITDHFLVKYDEYTENNLLNQILKFAARRLLVISNDEENKKILKTILLTLPEVEDLQKVTFEDLETVHFTRLNETYKPVYGLAKLFLQNLSIELRAAGTATYAFAIDMNRLYEEFVAEFLKQEAVLAVTRYSDCSIRSQTGARSMASSGGKDLFPVLPDIRLERLSDTCCIIDTKYKLLTDERTQFGISDQDVKTMFAYARRFNCGRTILLYPEHAQIQKKALRIDFFDGNWTEIHTIDIRRDLSRRQERILLKNELCEILNSDLR